MSISVIFTICLLRIPFIVKTDAKSIRSNSSDAFVIGAIVDMSSRVGKEARVAMEIAIDDFTAKTNQNLTLYTTNSKGNIVQAIQEGNSTHLMPFVLFNMFLFFLVKPICFMNLVEMQPPISLKHIKWRRF